jgi:hypothetical protein
VTDAFRIQGTEDLQRIGTALKEAGDKDLQKAVSGAIRSEAKPFGERVLRRGAGEMPARGGFRARVLGQGRVGVSASLRGRLASVSVILRNKGVDLKALDAGILRHPVFARQGMSRTWVRQSVPQGAFSRAFDLESAPVREKALDAAQGVLDDVARKA